MKKALVTFIAFGSCAPSPCLKSFSTMCMLSPDCLFLHKSLTLIDDRLPLQVTLDGAEQDANTITGGPLGDATYKLDHFYTNFGTAFKGSDHTIDGEAELGEIHFVHFASGYADLKDAIKSGKTDAISVVSVMLVEGEDESPAYQVLSKAASGDAVGMSRD